MELRYRIKIVKLLQGQTIEVVALGTNNYTR